MKKLISIILAVVLILSMATSVFAIGIQSSSEEVISIKECHLAGNKWLSANYNDGTEIKSIIPIKDLDGKINGYCINFSKNEEPNGYLVLNAAKYSASYIREFAFDGNGIYEQLLENSGLSKSVDVAIYTTNPFEYALKYTDVKGEYIYNCDSTILSIEAAKAQYLVNGIEYSVQDTSNRSADDKKEYYDSFFYGSSLTSYTDENDHVIPGADSFIPYKMSELRNGTNTGNCGPTAAANLCALYYSKGKTNILIDGDIDETYSALVTAVSFNENGTEGTYYSNLKSGIRNYVRGRSYSISINDYLFDTWGNFKGDFDDNKSNIIFIEGRKKNEAGQWITVGHFVVGIGYRVMNDGTRYVRIYDGWNKSNNRFLHFDADSLVTFCGASVSIS